MDLKLLIDTPPWDWPDNTGAKLKQVLRDRRSVASDRIVAADLAGQLTVMDDEMAGLLLKIVGSGDEPEKLRAAAAISLGPALEVADNEAFDDDLGESAIGEKTFRQIQETLHKVYIDERVPTEVRRRVLEASVRTPQDWHRDAIRAAAGSDQEDWKLTATFCMQWVPGFNDRILEMLDSPNPDIHYEAVRAARDQEVAEAWPHVAALLASAKTERQLLLAAIEAAASIRPDEAKPILTELADSEDEEIAEVASEALFMTEADFEEDDWEDEAEEGLPGANQHERGTSNGH